MEIGEPQPDGEQQQHGRTSAASPRSRSTCKANEAFVADGYGNKRVAVIDMDNGKIKRFWGAYGHVPSDSNLGPYNPDAPLAQQFRNPVHCAEPTPDGLVYVCDRPNDRIQVFKKNGEFVKEKIIKPQTKGDGSVWDIAFSTDPQQKYIFLADGKNEHVYVMDRQSLEILTEFGDGGRQPGQWFAVHSIATDSKGNIYTTETYEGKRIQKFVYKGMAAVEHEPGRRVAQTVNASPCSSPLPPPHPIRNQFVKLSALIVLCAPLGAALAQGSPTPAGSPTMTAVSMTEAQQIAAAVLPLPAEARASAKIMGYRTGARIS